MDIREKEFYILIVQVDHLQGEQLGYVIDVFYANGASNVQVIPTVTKKNRPSHIVMIDCKKDKIEAIEQTIVKELQTGGWHRIESTHRYLPNEILDFEIVLKQGENLELYTLQAKHFIGGGIRPEHSSVLALRTYIMQQYGITVEYMTLYNYACAVILDQHQVVLDVNQFI